MTLSLRSRRTRSQMGPRSTSIKRRSKSFAVEPVAVSHVDRPQTRGDCVDGPRPCPWAGCKHHLLLDVDPNTGTIKLNFGHFEPDALTETCALDVAAEGPHTLDEVGNLTNVTRERVRQLEAKALAELKRFGWRLR